MLATATEDDVEAGAGKRRERAERGRDVRRLRVVDIANATQLADELDAVRDALEGPQRPRDRLIVDPSRARRDGGGDGVLAVV